MKPISVEWIAGFIEGEGYFGHGSTNGCIRISVAQMDRTPLDEIDQFFTALGVKGRVYFHKNTGRGIYMYQTQTLLPHLRTPKKLAQIEENWGFAAADQLAAEQPPEVRSN